MQTDQTSQEAALADEVFATELPDVSNRLAVLGLLLSSIKAANTIAPNAWAVTLFRDGFRLNVGQVEAIVVGHDYVGLNCVGSVAVAPFNDSHFLATKYRSMPQPQCRYGGNASELRNLSPAILTAHRKFVELAARSPSGNPRAGTPFRKSHCEGLVKYATEFVNAHRKDSA